jgi:hypothetical protein
MMKKAMFGLTIAVMVIATGTALSAQNVADFKHEAKNGAVTITGYTGSAKNVTIPGRINNLPVTAIGYGAFRENQLTSVTIGNSVTTIRESAFYKNKLTSVTILNSVTAIGDRAFAENSLANISIGANVNVAVDSFPGNLADVYTQGGKRAGTYRSGDGGKTWSRR